MKGTSCVALVVECERNSLVVGVVPDMEAALEAGAMLNAKTIAVVSSLLGMADPGIGYYVVGLECLGGVPVAQHALPNNNFRPPSEPQQAAKPAGRGATAGGSMGDMPRPRSGMPDWRSGVAKQF